MARSLIIVIFLSFAPALSAQDHDIIVIANTQGEAVSLSKKQVRDLFMGGISRDNLEPVALPPGDTARVIFNTKVVGLTEARIQSYWAQMRFSGRSKPPHEVNNVQELIAYLQNNPGSVAYVTADIVVPDELTVLYQSRE